jgi:hypothetical protein
MSGDVVMDTRTRLAEIELMEKLAMLEADAPVDELSKTASDSGMDRTTYMRKVAQVVSASRRAGRARAEAEFAALRTR